MVKFKEKFKVKVNFLDMAAIELDIRVIVKVNCKGCEAFKFRIMKFAYSRSGINFVDAAACNDSLLRSNELTDGRIGYLGSKASQLYASKQNVI